MSLSKDKIVKLLKMNNTFYEKVSKEFSNTRQYPWEAWNKIIETYISNNKNTIKILDIGCGNGRFLKYIENNYKNFESNIKYIGIDINEDLLSIAKKEAEGFKINHKFEKLDIFQELNKITEQFDLVVGFGITHHIPGKDFRKEWFKTISKLLNDNGILILSYWNFLKKNNIQKAENLEEEDYFVGWNNISNKRYCHYYNQEELDLLNSILNKNNIKIVTDINSSEDLNRYIIYRYNN